MKKLYQVVLLGCDDTTYIDMELTEEEAQLVELIAKKSEEESSYGCMPTLELREKE